MAPMMSVIVGSVLVYLTNAEKYGVQVVSSVFSSHQCIAITSCAHFKIGCSQLSNEKKKCPLFFTKFEKKPL
jgi:hypothetical protein